MKLKIGITGQEGFVGQHLYHNLGLLPDKYERVDYHISYFSDDDKLASFVNECDVIVHLAAINRHEDAQQLYHINLELVKKLIAALEQCASPKHVLFSSSSQEERDNPYGQSKKEGRELLIDWAERSGGKFTGLIIPNVFGPFGRPYYNSFIATFAHQLCHNEQPQIAQDSSVNLIYVDDLAKFIIKQIATNNSQYNLLVPHSTTRQVSEVLELLQQYKVAYLEKGIIPELKTKFELDLFNTFRCYIDLKAHNPVSLKKNSDDRGDFVELVRLNIGGQVSFSTTRPGITRGNHYHTRKIERFAVIKGKALIQLRRVGTTEVLDFYLDGENPSYVDMPIWYSHNIKNIGDEMLYTIFWINEAYDPADADTYFEVV